MHVLILGNEVPVVGAPGITDAQLTAAVNSPKFQDWAKSVEPGLVVTKVEIQSVDLFPTKPEPTVGFIKFNASTTKDGKFVPGIAFVRGDCVGILVVLNCQGKKFTLLAVQPRVPMGSVGFTEIPAGMLDNNGNFAGVAAKELGEEAGIKITADDLAGNELRELATGTAGPIAMSPGGSDEMMHLFLHEQEIEPDALADLEGKLTGELDAGEMISLKVVPFDDIWSVPDIKTIAAAGFYSQLGR